MTTVFLFSLLFSLNGYLDKIKSRYNFQIYRIINLTNNKITKNWIKNIARLELEVKLIEEDENISNLMEILATEMKRNNYRHLFPLFQQGITSLSYKKSNY